MPMKYNNANTLLSGFNNILPISDTVVAENVVFKQKIFYSLKDLLILKLGFIIYPIEKSLICLFVSSSQI